MRSAIAAVLVLLSIVGCGPDNSKAQETVTKSLFGGRTVDPESLGREYRENEIAADKKYKDQVLIVTGKIGNVHSGSSPWFDIQTPFGTEDIHCEFAAGHESELATLRPGATVTVKGLCTGKVPIMGVTLAGCQIQSR